MTTEIKEIYSKFLRLYEKLAEEREVITQQGVVLGKIIGALDAETKLATEFKVQVRNGLKESISQATQDVSGDVKNVLQKTITEDISSTIKDLKSAVEQSNKQRCQYGLLSSHWLWIFFVGVVFASIGIGIMCAKYVMPLPLSDRQFELYSEGQRFEGFWDRLSKKEHNRLNAIAEHQLPPEKDSVVWIMKNNPNMKLSEVVQKFEEAGKKVNTN